MKKQIIGFFLLSVAAASAATYTVDVNTSSLSGTTGSLDFQFNPGVGTYQTASATISNVAGGSYGGSQQVFGTGVSGGPIPSAITLTNISGDNEVLDSYKFSSNLTFSLNLSGPAITSPNGSDTAGSLFAFSVFSDAAGTIPALTSDPSGVAMTVSLNDQGALSSNISSPDVFITPEPSTLALMSAPLVLFALIRRRKA